MITKPHKLVSYPINKYIVEAVTPAYMKNDFFRGVRIIIGLEDKSFSYEINTLYPIAYDEDNGFGGIDQSDLITLDNILLEVNTILKESDNNLDAALRKRITNIINHAS